MKKYNIILLLLVLELSCFQGHAILKREANEVDTYKVKEDTDTLEIINPKAKKPTLREIIYYHVIEKPYPGKHISEENDFKAQFKDVTRPFTNGHGFQYLNENKHDEKESNEVKEPTNDETAPKLQIHDEKEPETPVRDEKDLGDLKTADEMHHGEINKDEVPNEMIPNDEIINVKDDKPSHDQIEAMRRRKREIDYTIMPAAPPLPAFRMDILPDYIKAILPTDNEPTQTLKSKSIERPITITNIPETSTEKSRNSDAEIPRISIRIDDDEKTDHKIIKKSTSNVDDEIEKEIREVIRKVSDAANGQADSPDPRSYGMDLIGNSGIVWNDLNNQHLQYNVGPDANNEEVHNEQIPIKPQQVTDNEDNDLVNEIATTLNELEHILEEVIPNNNNLNEGTTESNDIEVIINKNQNKHKEKPQIKTQKKKYKVEEETQTKKEFTPKIDPRSLINDNTNEIEPKSIINPDNAIDLETALNFLEVLQDIVANLNNNEPRNDSNKEDSKVKSKNVTDEPERDRKHNHHKEKGDKDTSNKNEIDDLLNNDKYWQWLKDSSQATLNLLMKRVNGLIKEEVAQQIQELVTKMMEEQGYQHPETKEPEKQEDDETKPTDDNNETKFSGDDKEKNDITIEESDDNPQVLDKLMKNDKWKWLTNSSEAYLGALMKRINNLIKEEVTRQVEHLMKYHMPKTDQSDNDNKQNTTEDIKAQKDESKDNINGDPKKDLKNRKEKIKTLKTAKDDLETDPKKLENKDKSKSHKKTQNEDKKNTERKKKPLINIQAENSYGSSVGNEKVTNIFIFNLNGTDLKNLKPISSGNGMFIFGTEKNNNSAENNNSNKEINEPPTTNEIKETDSSKMNSTTDSNKDKTSEEAKPINEVEKPNSDSQENSNKDESTITSSPTDKNINISESDSSSKDKHNNKEKNPDSSQKDKISEDHKNKDKSPSEENPVNNEKADSEVETESTKTENKSAEVTKTESNDETKHNSNTEEKTSESKELKDLKDSKKSDENEEVKPESIDKTD